MFGLNSPLHWLLVLLVVLLVFGTKKLRNIGEDLGAGIRGFKEGLKSGEKSPAEKTMDAVPPQQVSGGQTIEGEIKEKTKS